MEKKSGKKIFVIDKTDLEIRKTSEFLEETYDRIYEIRREIELINNDQMKLY